MSKKYLAITFFTNTLIILVLVFLFTFIGPVLSYDENLIFVTFLTIPVLFLINLSGLVFSLRRLKPFDFYTKVGFWINIIVIAVTLLLIGTGGFYFYSFSTIAPQ